jgi:predicted GIY-YIG superfamily endonuclease
MLEFADLQTLEPRSEISGPWYVYAVVDPRDRRIFYIGYTGDMDTRVKSHNAGGHAKSGERIKQIMANGLLPLYVILETSDTEAAALRAEVFWIETMRARNAMLSNNINMINRLVSVSYRDGLKYLQEIKRVWPEIDVFALVHLHPNGRITSSSAIVPFESSQPRDVRRHQKFVKGPSRHGQPWLTDEDKRLKHMFTVENRGARHMARELERTVASVAQRMVKLGLVSDKSEVVS